MKTMLSLVLGMVAACAVAMGEEEKPVDDGKLDPVAKVVLSKLDRTVIPKVEMENASLEEAVDFTRLKMAEYDPEAKVPEKMGISFVIRPPRALTEAEAEAEAESKKAEEEPQRGPGGLGGPADVGAKRVTLDLRNVKALDLLGELGRQGGTDVYVTSKGMRLVAEGVKPDEGEVWKVVRVKVGDDAKKLLEGVRMPVVDFDETSVGEAVDFLRVRTMEMDAGQTEKKGIGFVERKPRGKEVPDRPGYPLSEEEQAALPRLTYSAKDVTFGAVLKEIARQAKLDVYLTTGGLLLRPAGKAAFESEREEAASLVEVIYRWEGK